jgi:Rieske Fe-S protein
LTSHCTTSKVRFTPRTTSARMRRPCGWLDGDVIECPLHGGRFEVKTGKGLGAPITCDLKTFPVRIEGTSFRSKYRASALRRQLR